MGAMDTANDSLHKYLKPVRISHLDPVFSQVEMDAANEINVWHKFILFNVTKNDKTFILDSIIETASPVFFLPIMYNMESENKATFLTFCRSNVIQKLVNQKLQIKLRNGKTIYYDIVLSFLPFRDMQINPQGVITNVIRSRFLKEGPTKKTFNLENFTNDRLLGSVYCPIHIPVVFDSILRFARSVVSANNNRDAKIPVRDLILRNNKMESLYFTEKVFTFHFTKLDLRDNKLMDVSTLRPFAEFKITELWLDGNPLCNYYDTPKDYIEAVRSMFPHLQVLDGQVVGTEQSLVPVNSKQFIRDKGKAKLIKQFIEHFFTCYDQDDRIVLNGLYDAGALFSMTVGPITDESHKQIIKSFATNRNLLKFVDYAKCTDFLLYGPEKIISALRREPATLHKLKYLDIDMLYTTHNSFSLSLQGPFIYRKTSVPPLWFHRTLIVVAKDDNEYCIINDQYHIDNCPAHLSMDLVDYKNVTKKSVPVFEPISFSTAEKYQLLRLLQELTTMNTEFSDKFLKEANWDIRSAIKNFMHLYKNNKIPLEAFRW